MVQESWSWDHGKAPILGFSVSIHKTRGSEWSNRAYKRVSRESLQFFFEKEAVDRLALFSEWDLPESNMRDKSHEGDHGGLLGSEAGNHDGNIAQSLWGAKRIKLGWREYQRWKLSEDN